MKPSNTPDDEGSAGVQRFSSGRNRDGRLSHGISDVAIFAVVALIGAAQLGNWMLGKGKRSDRLKIL